MVVATTTATFRCHHAGLGLDLNLGIDLEVALRHDQFALVEPMTHKEIVASPRPQHDLAALESRLSPRRKLLAGLVHGGFESSESFFGLFQCANALAC